MQKISAVVLAFIGLGLIFKLFVSNDGRDPMTLEEPSLQPEESNLRTANPDLVDVPYNQDSGLEANATIKHKQFNPDSLASDSEDELEPKEWKADDYSKQNPGTHFKLADLLIGPEIAANPHELLIRTAINEVAPLKSLDSLPAEYLAMLFTGSFTGHLSIFEEPENKRELQLIIDGELLDHEFLGTIEMRTFSRNDQSHNWGFSGEGDLSKRFKILKVDDINTIILPAPQRGGRIDIYQLIFLNRHHIIGNYFKMSNDGKLYRVGDFSLDRNNIEH